jgi:hypothetical protein
MVLIAVGSPSFGAEQKEGARRQRGGRSIPFTMEVIKERLGTENALKEDQEKKVQAVNEEFTKKMEEFKAKPEVKAAYEEIAKARESGDRNKMREAFKKMRESMGSSPYEDYKKALSAVLDKDQIAKLFPQRRGGRQRGEQKPEQK